MACPLTAGSSGRVARFVERAGKELGDLIKKRIDTEVRDKVKSYTDSLVFEIVTQEMAKYAIELDSVMHTDRFEQSVNINIRYAEPPAKTEEKK